MKSRSYYFIFVWNQNQNEYRLSSTVSELQASLSFSTSTSTPVVPIQTSPARSPKIDYDKLQTLMNKMKEEKSNFRPGYHKSMSG
jgi:hypothetical protein